MSENIIKTIPNELDGNERYAIRVRTVNSFGVSSDWSEVLIVDTDNPGAANSGRITLTANGLIAYDSNGQTSIIYSGSGVAQRINYIINPSFEVDASAWSALSSSTIARSPSDFYFGDAATPGYKACLEIAASGIASGVGAVTAAADRIPVSAGAVYTGSIFVKAVTVPVTLKIALRFYDNNGDQILETTSFSPKTILADTKWVRISCIAAKVPPGAVRMGFVVFSTSDMVSGQKYRIDGCLVEQTSILGEYFDGSTSIGATKWNGTAHHSTSTFDMSATSYVDGGIFTSGTVQTDVDVGIGSPYPKAGVVMNIDGLKGYSGIQVGPSFDLDTAGKLRVGNEDNFMDWDGTDIAFQTSGTFRVGDDINYIYWDGVNLTLTGGASATAISIDADGTPATSFHVDDTGRLWMGAADFTSAPFKIAANGNMKIVYSGGDYMEFNDAFGSPTLRFGPNTATVPPIINSLTGLDIYPQAALRLFCGTSFFAYAYAGNVSIGCASGGNVLIYATTTGRVDILGTHGRYIAMTEDVGWTTKMVLSAGEVYISADLTFGAANPILWSASYIIVQGGLLVNGGYLYVNNGIYARGGIYNDTGNLTLGSYCVLDANGKLRLAGGSTSYLGGGGQAAGGITGGSGAVLVCDNGTNFIHFHWTGANLLFYIDATDVTSSVKSFVIDHPTKSDEYLMHACAEGPTADVFYRGEGQLSDGACFITLPDYFEALTELDGRTVQITSIYEREALDLPLSSTRIINGAFYVIAQGHSNQKFYWRVDAIRKNTKFDVEPKKSETKVSGSGPYTYIVK